MDKICPVCGKAFSTNHKTAIYCSTTCRGEARKNYKICLVCGKRFPCTPCLDTICCSPECSAKHRREIYLTQDKYACVRGENLERIRSEYAAAHQGEAHPGAKIYLLQGPDGRTHEATNLANWVRECGLFDNPRTALRALHSTNPESRSRKKCSNYYGWSILAIIGQNSPGKPPPRYCKFCGKMLPAIKRSYCGRECYNASRRKGAAQKSD